MILTASNVRYISFQRNLQLKNHLSSYQRFDRNLIEIWARFGRHLAYNWPRKLASRRKSKRYYTYSFFILSFAGRTPPQKKNPALRITRHGILGFVCRCSADYTLISTSTPQGSSSFIRASTVLALLL